MSRSRSPRRPSLPLLAAGLVVCSGLLMAPTLTRALQSGPEPSSIPSAPAVTPVAPSIATPPPKRSERRPCSPGGDPSGGESTSRRMRPPEATTIHSPLPPPRRQS